MSGLRNDSRGFGCGLGVLASVLFCLAAATAAADDLDPAADPLIAAIDAFIAELDLDKSDKDWKSTRACAWRYGRVRSREDLLLESGDQPGRPQDRAASSNLRPSMY